jgi:hypothetical protein
VRRPGACAATHRKSDARPERQKRSHFAAAGVRQLSAIITTPPLPLLVLMTLRRTLPRSRASSWAPPGLKAAMDHGARVIEE